MWVTVQHLFGGQSGHTCDLMALDSNAMRDRQGEPLPHFTPYASPGSSGVNVFSQDLSLHSAILQKAYVFPPLVLVGPLLRFLESYKQSCTVVVHRCGTQENIGGRSCNTDRRSLINWPQRKAVVRCSRRRRKDGRPTPVSQEISGPSSSCYSHYNFIIKKEQNIPVWEICSLFCLFPRQHNKAAGKEISFMC